MSSQFLVSPKQSKTLEVNCEKWLRGSHPHWRAETYARKDAVIRRYIHYGDLHRKVNPSEHRLHLTGLASTMFGESFSPTRATWLSGGEIFSHFCNCSEN